jgi:hypothetical protein
MDPNENLRQIRAAVTGYYDGPLTSDEAVEALAPLAQALDEWLSKGGALPHDWQNCVRCENCRRDKTHGI